MIKKEELNKEYRVVMPQKVHQKIQLYAKHAPGEVSGLGKVHYSNGTFTVPEIYLFKQVSSAGDTILNQKDVAIFLSSMMDKNEPLEELKLWWHSHGDMEVFWSRTDDTNIDDFDNEQISDNWLLSIVVNKSRDILARLDVYAPFRFTLDEIPVEIVYDEEEEALIKKEVEEKVSAPVEPTFRHLSRYDDDDRDIDGAYARYTKKEMKGIKDREAIGLGDEDPEDIGEYAVIYDKNGKPFWDPEEKTEVAKNE